MADTNDTVAHISFGHKPSTAWSMAEEDKPEPDRIVVAHERMLARLEEGEIECSNASYEKCLALCVTAAGTQLWLAQNIYFQVAARPQMGSRSEPSLTKYDWGSLAAAKKYSIESIKWLVLALEATHKVTDFPSFARRYTINNYDTVYEPPSLRSVGYSLACQACAQWSEHTRSEYNRIVSELRDKYPGSATGMPEPIQGAVYGSEVQSI